MEEVREESGRRLKDQFWRSFKAIRRMDIALAYSWIGVIITGVVLFAADLFALSLVITNQHIVVAAVVAENAVLGSMFLILLVYSRRGVRRLERMVKEAKDLMQSTGITIPGRLSVAPGGIVYSGLWGRERTCRWDEIEAVVYGRGSVDFRMKNRRIVITQATNYCGLDYDLKEVALAITKNLPNDKWFGAREWIDSQLGGSVQRLPSNLLPCPSEKTEG